MGGQPNGAYAPAGMDSSSWFQRLAVFVVVLVVLDRFLAWNVSIIGSLLATFLVYAIMRALETRRSSS